MAPRPAAQVADWQTLDPGDWKEIGPSAEKERPRVSGGQKVLDYANDTLSNVPGSAMKLAKGIGTALMHPIDTAEGLGKVVTGTVQNMTPGYVTPDRPGYSKEADAAWGALKDRYGSPHAIAESIRTDPVGVAADISAVAGGVSGLAKGVGVAADAANFGRTANAASKTAKVASAISDATNPVNLVTKPVGMAAKAVGRGFAKSALGLPGRSERYGATPAVAALEETTGITPSAVKASAIAKLADLETELQSLTAKATRDPSLQPAIDVISREIAKVKRANGLTADLEGMREQLTQPRAGFGGAVDMNSGTITPNQDPLTFLEMQRQFGDDYTKFDAAIPLKNAARNLGNKAYHEMGTEFNSAVPGAKEVRQRMQSLIPVKEGAARAGEHVGPVQNAVNRLTRPTGGAVGLLLHGPAALIGQEALSSPTVKMGIARGTYGAGKAIKSPITSRTMNAAGVAGVAGGADDTIAKRLSDSILGGQQ